MKYILYFAVLLLFSSFVGAQTVRKDSLKADIETKIKTLKDHKHYEIKYDKFKDLTTVLARGFSVSTEKNIFNYRSIYCSVGFEFDGEKLKKDLDHFILAIEIHSQHQAMFSSKPGLILLADGQRLKQETGEYTFDVKSLSPLMNMTSTDETILYPINAQDFQKLAVAKHIEFQIGTKEFTFKAEMLDVFKNLYQLAFGS